MVKFSNSVIGVLNFLTLLLSIPVIVTGVWMSKVANDDCERWLNLPILTLGIALLAVSLIGFIGSCCRVTWLLWIYLLVMFLLIIVVFAFTIFAHSVANKGAGESGGGINQYRVTNYSKWLQEWVNNTERWNKFRSCMQYSKICSVYKSRFLGFIADNLYSKRLSTVTDGCCKPSKDCNFINQSPNVWNKPTNATYSNVDCDAWNNDPMFLCFNCQSCKAGILENIRSFLKRMAVVNIVCLVFLIIMFFIGCCAFTNNRNNWKRI